LLRVDVIFLDVAWHGHAAAELFNVKLESQWGEGMQNTRRRKIVAQCLRIREASGALLTVTVNRGGIQTNTASLRGRAVRSIAERTHSCTPAGYEEAGERTPAED